MNGIEMENNFNWKITYFAYTWPKNKSLKLKQLRNR